MGLLGVLSRGKGKLRMYRNYHELGDLLFNEKVEVKLGTLQLI